MFWVSRRYLSARYHRIKSRRGHAKATVATAHKILTAAYHVLDQGVAYHELGEEFFYRPAELRVLGVPDGIEPVAFLCLGYPDERPIRPGLESAGWASRRPLEELVFEERWLGDRPGGPRAKASRRRRGHRG